MSAKDMQVKAKVDQADSRQGPVQLTGSSKPGMALAGPQHSALAAHSLALNAGSSQAVAQFKAPLQRAPNRTGMPDALKAGVESLSGISMDHVRVHYNSVKPAQMNALAYAQGSEIHLGSGQERQLPHEAWHVVQQAQGRVRATRQLASELGVNSDGGLEGEADIMGQRATQMKGVGLCAKPVPRAAPQPVPSQPDAPLQMKITVDNISYSFSQVHDGAGNPLLLPKNPIEGDKDMVYKMQEDQQNLQIKKVPLLEAATDSSKEEERKRIFHNIARGRPQIVNDGEGVLSILAPVKGYNFGYETRPDVAHFKLSEDDNITGEKYPKFFDRVTKILIDSATSGNSITLSGTSKEWRGKLDLVYKDLKSVVLAEEYRTPGALMHLDVQWTTMLEKLQESSLERQMKSDTKSEITMPAGVQQTVAAATSRLEFAGEGGKDKFRAFLLEKDNITVKQANNFPILTRSGSVDETDPGVTSEVQKKRSVLSSSAEGSSEVRGAGSSLNISTWSAEVSGDEANLSSNNNALSSSLASSSNKRNKTKK